MQTVEGAPAPTAARAGRLLRRIQGAVRLPLSGLASVTRVLIAGAVVAAPSVIVAVLDDPEVRTAAAVTPQPVLPPGWTAESPTDTAANPRLLTEAVGPPPPAAVTEPGRLHIPAVALAAYRNADGVMARTHPGCHLSWNLLAGIGYIESRHAFGGAVDHRGTAVDPIFGPTLDGSLPGNEIIVAGQANGRTVYARAMGPMQFLPGTWELFGVDGDHDGRADPQNLFDATLAAAHYLCSGGADLRDRSALVSAVLRYNNSMAYTENVLGWAQAYATGEPPGYLPPINPPPARRVPVRTVAAPAATAPADRARCRRSRAATDRRCAGAARSPVPRPPRRPPDRPDRPDRLGRAHARPGRVSAPVVRRRVRAGADRRRRSRSATAAPARPAEPDSGAKTIAVRSDR